MKPTSSEERLVAVLAVVLLGERTIDRQRTDLRDPQALVSARRITSPTSPRRTPSGFTMSSVDSTVILGVLHERPAGVRDSVQRARHQDEVFEAARAAASSASGTDGKGSVAMPGRPSRPPPPAASAPERCRPPSRIRRRRAGRAEPRCPRDPCRRRRQYEVQPIPREGVGQRLGERTGRGRVVGAVQMTSGRRPRPPAVRGGRGTEREPDGVGVQARSSRASTATTAAEALCAACSP